MFGLSFFVALLELAPVVSLEELEVSGEVELLVSAREVSLLASVEVLLRVVSVELLVLLALLLTLMSDETLVTPWVSRASAIARPTMSALSAEPLSMTSPF